VKVRRKHLILIGSIVTGAVLVALSLRPGAVEVETVRADRGPFRVTVDEDGVTRIRRHALVAAPVNGRVAEAAVTAGDSVTAGAIVARLTPAPLDARAREEATASLSAAQALTTEAQAHVAQARVALDEAQRAHQRAIRLAAAGGVSQRDLEGAAATLEMLRRDLDAAVARERASQEEERRAGSALLEANSSGGDDRATLLLRSPIAGRVLHVYEEHERVVPAGAPLLEVGDPSQIEVVVDVLTRDAPDIRPGARIVVRAAGRTLDACVDRVEPAAFTKVSPLGVEEQRVNVIGRFLLPVNGLGDGFEVDASIVLWESSSTLTVPLTALVPVDSTWSAFVLAGGRARLRPMSIGHRGSHDAEVLSGLREGDSVIVYPDERLQDGARVRVRG
jgi:HlyD family secretion protein